MSTTDATTTTVTATDGIELHVRLLGDPAGTPVVLVHGFPDSGAVWLPVARRLAEDGHRVVVPDVRGTGASGVPAGDDGYRLPQLAADLRAVVDATVPDRPVHLVGHDWGSVQSWEAVGTDALDGRLASYTSISGPSLDHIGAWMRSRPTGRRDVGRRVRQAIKSWYVLAFHSDVAERAWRGGIAERFPQILARTEGIAPGADHPAPTLVEDGAHGMALYRANVGDRARDPRPRTTEVPVQLVVPTGDRYVTPSMADAALPHCSTVERREVATGHWGLLLDRPAWTASLLADWCARVDAGDVAVGVRYVEPSLRSGRFDGRLVVVTGAGRGIGRETALAFARRGARVVVADRDLEPAEAVAGSIRATGGEAVAVGVDVADGEAMDAFVRAVLADHGVPDVVVSNAGIGMAGPFLDTTSEEWDRILDVNVRGVIDGCRGFGRAMVERGEGGHLVNLASAAAFLPSRTLPAYATTKAAVLMLSECLRAELAEHGIGVSAICPGIVDTGITDRTRFVGTDDATEAEQRQRTSALYRRRNFTPDRVAEAVVDAVVHDLAVVPVAPEAHAMRWLGRLAPPAARWVARRDLG